MNERESFGDIAVVEGSRTISYENLWNDAMNVAGFLQSQGVLPGAAVGVVIDRTSRHLINILGILIAGAAYVPLSARDTLARQERILQCSGVELVIGRTTTESTIAPWVACPPPGAESGLQSRDVEVDAKSPAYVLCTSGTSGEPKGVAMSHGALVNLLTWHQETRPGSCQLRTLQFCDTRFDFSFHEIFSTLCFGGSLVLTEDAVRAEPTRLWRHIETFKVERAFFPVPILRRMAVASERLDLNLHLSAVVTTGARLHLTDAERSLFGRCGAELHNHYGATEFQDATTATLTGDPFTWPEFPSIGRPIAGMRVEILDTNRERVEPGHLGEIVVSGIGVAEGYINCTNSRKSGFGNSDAAGGRRYRTGDLGLFDSSGDIHVCGRVDNEIRVGGFRVQPEELEGLLEQEPSISQAAVISENVGGRVSLVVVVIVKEGADPSEVRGLARLRIDDATPGMLVPPRCVVLAELPLTATGKVDRRKLSSDVATKDR